jgi:TP901-1 family phage major tail protein
MTIKGSSVVLKKGTASGGTMVAAGRTYGADFALDVVDVTSADDTDGWRELLDGAGNFSGTISFSGVLKDVASHEAIRADFLARTAVAYGMVVGNAFTIDGLWMISAYNFSAEYNAETEQSFTLTSSGLITFANVA